MAPGGQGQQGHSPVARALAQLPRVPRVAPTAGPTHLQRQQLRLQAASASGQAPWPSIPNTWREKEEEYFMTHRKFRKPKFQGV